MTQQVIIAKATSNSTVAEDSTHKETLVDADMVVEKMSTWKFILVFCALVLGVFINTLDYSIVPQAVPSIGKEFGLDKISWIGVSYLLTATATAPIYGSICDIFGRKISFIVALTCFAAGYLICGLAQSIDVIIAGRAIAGLGSGGTAATALIIVADIVSLKSRGRYQGILGSVLGISSIIGPILGGYFVDNVSWRWCFLFSVPVAVFTIILALFTMEFHVPKGSLVEKVSKIDFLGCFLILATTICLLMPLQLSGTLWDWNSPQTITLLCVVPALLTIFVYTQLKVSSNPILPPRLFSRSAVPLIYAVTFCSGLCFGTLLFYMPIYFQYVVGDKAIISGFKAIPMFVGVTIMSISSGQIVSFTGRYKIFFFLAPVFLITGFALLSTMKADISLAAVIFYLLIPGMGVGFLVQVRVLSLQASVAQEMVAIATASVSVFNYRAICFSIWGLHLVSQSVDQFFLIP
jgi:EmrB/QacA subfamily drug resistance transporter